MSRENQGRSLRTKFQMLKREELKRDLTGLDRDSNGITDDPKLDTSMTYADLLEMVELLLIKGASLEAAAYHHSEMFKIIHAGRKDALAMLLLAREQRDEALQDLAFARDNVVRLRRDCYQARRWLCSILADPQCVAKLAKPGDGSKYAFAKEQGWDCFKEPTP